MHLIAAEMTHRKCCGVELNPVYCDVIIRRWQQFTGRQATRDAVPYDAIVAAKAPAGAEPPANAEPQAAE